MATRIWRGDAPAVAQVDFLTVGGTVEADDIFIVTINGKSVSTVAGSTTLATVATNIATALAASSIPEFQEITWITNSAVVIGTSKTAGRPFTVTVSTTETGGGAADAQTFVRSASVANSGPNNWDVAANWHDGAGGGAAVPVNSDDVFIQNSNVDILYGLAQSAVTLTSLTIDKSFTGKIGLPRRNPGGYAEYRAIILAIGATTVTIGSGEGAGSGRIKLNTGSAQTTLLVLGTGSPAEQALESLLWKGTHASNVVNINKGSVGIAVEAGDTATVATLRVGYTTSVGGDSTVRCGSGVTLTTVNQSGGTLTTASAITTVNKTDGELVHLAGAITTLNEQGGATRYLSTSTLATANVSDGGELDLRRDMRARTIATLNLFKGAIFRDPFRTATITNGIDLTQCSIADVTIDVGTHVNLAITAA